MNKKICLLVSLIIIFTLPLLANNIHFDSTVNTYRGKSTTTTFYSTTSDAYLVGSGSSDYTTVHDASEARDMWAATQGNNVNVGQSKPYSWYNIFRAGLYFDTSSIPDDAVISSATLSFCGLYDYSDIDFDIVVVDGSVIEDPMVKADYGDLKDKTTSGGSMNTSGFYTDKTTYMHITLNSDGRGWISKTGTTKLGLRSLEDINSSPPGAGTDNEEYVCIYDNQDDPNYLPKLEVTYTSIVTVTGTSIAPAGASPGDIEVGMLKLGLVTDGGSATWTNVKVDLTGAAVDGDISSVEVWKDDGDGTWEGTGHDTEIGSGIFNSNTSTIDITDQTITTDSWDFFIVYDIAVGAEPTHEAGAKLLDNTYITVSGSDEVSSTGFPIESNTATLPVTLSTFTAQFLNGVPTLYWKTESETDNLGWFVYRNREENFTTAAKVSGMIEGHGTTTQTQSYVHEDVITNPQVGDVYYYWLESVDYSGLIHHYDRVAIMRITEIDDQNPHVTVPKKYGLQTGPNPFNSNLTVSYMLPQTDMVRIQIYNLYGQLVAKFNEGLRTADNQYTVDWNGQDLYGQNVASGVLLIKLITSEGSETTKAILLR